MHMEAGRAALAPRQHELQHAATGLGPTRSRTGNVTVKARGLEQAVQDGQGGHAAGDGQRTEGQRDGDIHEAGPV